MGYATYKAFLKRLLSDLNESFGKNVILSFALFGSAARGEARPDSDLDLLVVHCPIEFGLVACFVSILIKKTYNSEEYSKIQERGISADPYVIFMTEADLYERPLILLGILDHGIIIHDDGTLKRGLNL